MESSITGAISAEINISKLKPGVLWLRHSPQTHTLAEGWVVLSIKRRISAFIPKLKIPSEFWLQSLRANFRTLMLGSSALYQINA